MGLQVADCKKAGSSRMSSYVDWDDQSLAPFSLARKATNVRYIETSVATRYGLKRQLSLAVNGVRITGLTVLNYKGASAALDKDIVVFFGSNGDLYWENPNGSGIVAQLNPTLLSLTANKFLQAAAAYNRLHCATSDLVTGADFPIVVDSNGNVDPLSMIRIGEPWTRLTRYNVGDVISPTVANGHLYRAFAITTGMSAAVEPVFPTAEGAAVLDDGVIWQEYTYNASTVLPPPTAPAIATVAAVGTLPAARDIYIKVQEISAQGGTLGSVASVKVNTVLNDRIVVTSPVDPSTQHNYLVTLGAGFKGVSYNVFAASVATGAAAPADAAYFKQNGAVIANGVNFNLDAILVVTPMPTVASAWLDATPGNICAGDRWMVVVYFNRNNYICGMSNAAPIKISVGAAGRRLFTGQIPVGPSNTIYRAVGFTVPGRGPAGPYFFIPKDDVDANGVAISSTKILDNATTSASFNFTDVYLPTGFNITEYFQKRRVPACTDIYFSESLGRLVFTGSSEQPSAHYISHSGGDPETLYTDVDVVAVADSNSQRTVAWRELNGVQYSLKSGSGHKVTPNDNNANTWRTDQQWGGSGPCNCRAIGIIPKANNETDVETMLYVHDSGIYRFAGQDPMWISEELFNFWKTINWAAKSTIWVCPDPNSHEVHFGFPVNGSTVPNKVLTLNYAEGWNKAYVFMVRSRAYVTVPGRKWAINDITAHSGLRVSRALAAPPEATLANSQFLWASARAADNGAVHMTVPGQYSDLLDGVTKTAIDSQYYTTYGPPKSTVESNLFGLAAQLKGAGRASMTVRGMRNQPANNPPVGNYPAKDAVFVDDGELYYTSGYSGSQKNYGFGLEITNKNTADYYFELHQYDIFYKSKFAAKV